MTRVPSSLGIIILGGFLIACDQGVTEQDLVGTWLLDDAVVDEFIAEARAAAKDKNEKSVLNAMEPLLRRMAGKQGIEFTATELREIRGTRSTSVAYQVASVVGRNITILVKGREFVATIDGDMLVLSDKTGKRPTPYRRLRTSEVAAFNEKLEKARRGPGPEASPDSRMMWVINAERDKAARYIEKYADMVTLRNERGDTLLHKAVSARKVELVKLLLAKGSDVNAVNEFKMAPLNSALSTFESTPELMELLIEAGASLELRNNVRQTPLDYAVGKNNLALARYLLKKGAPVDARKTPDDMTPFMRTVYSSNVEMAQLLLDQGADLDARWLDDGEALCIAARYSSHETLQFLLDKGMDPNQQNSKGWTPLSNVLFRDDGRLEATRQMVAAGADINASSRNPLLILALRDQDVEWVRGLLEMGANPKVRSLVGESALDIARKTGNAELIELMQNAGG